MFLYSSWPAGASLTYLFAELDFVCVKMENLFRPCLERVLATHKPYLILPANWAGVSAAHQSPSVLLLAQAGLCVPALGTWLRHLHWRVEGSRTKVCECQAGVSKSSTRFIIDPIPAKQLATPEPGAAPSVGLGL